MILTDPSSLLWQAIASAPPPPPSPADVAEEARIKSMLDKFAKREVSDA